MRIKGIEFNNLRWADSNGCYYNADGEPAGWIILSADKKH